MTNFASTDKDGVSGGIPGGLGPKENADPATQAAYVAMSAYNFISFIRAGYSALRAMGGYAWRQISGRLAGDRALKALGTGAGQGGAKALAAGAGDDAARAAAAAGRSAAAPGTPIAIEIAGAWREGHHDVLLVKYSGRVQPFYRRSGFGSLDEMPTHGAGAQKGQWAPFDGFLAGDYDKIRFGTEAGFPVGHPLRRFGTEEFRQISEQLGQMNIPKGMGISVKTEWDALQREFQKLGVNVRVPLK